MESEGIMRIITAIIVFFSSLFGGGEATSVGVIGGDSAQQAEVSADAMEVHFIDVGQGDCTLIKLKDGRTVLIDAGNNGDFKIIKPYLDSAGVNRIDYLVGTHPHADHIGAMDDVIKNYDIGKLYMPKAETNTKTFKDVLKAVSDKGLKITTGKRGVKVIDEDNLKLVMLAPNSDKYDELNNYSIVMRLTYGNTSFLFEGDAEDVSEREILQNGDDVKADVIKVGHHGSSSSSTEEYIDAVSPKHAVISCGVDNDYNHPHKETMQCLGERNINILRTDKDGSIIFKSDGKNISYEKTGK